MLRGTAIFQKLATPQQYLDSQLQRLFEQYSISRFFVCFAYEKPTDANLSGQPYSQVNKRLH